MDIVSSTQTEFDGEHFKDLNVAENTVIAGKMFYDCRFANCIFREVQFVKCRFRDCQFEACDLSLMAVDGSSFADIHFERCQVIGVNWANADWPKFTLPRPLNFRECAISYSTFFGVSLQQCDFVNCAAKDVDFSEANLTKAKCTGTDFAKSRFLHTDLTEADFNDAQNYAINANANVLKKTRFALPEAMSLLRSLDIVLTE